MTKGGSITDSTYESRSDFRHHRPLVSNSLSFRSAQVGDRVMTTGLSLATLPTTDRRRRNAQRLAQFGLGDPSQAPKPSAAAGTSGLPPFDDLVKLRCLHVRH